jgi:metal-dependent HD superfamily phosphatase/phosphodiesterase
MKSPKELSLDKKIIAQLETMLPPQLSADNWLPEKTLKLLMADAEIEAAQNYANTVSLVRLGYNDHGPVHMRMVTLNALKMMQLLKEAGIKTNLENENSGIFEDSLTAVSLAAFLHDFGMSVGRQDHELFSVMLALPIITRILELALPSSDAHSVVRRAVIRSLAVEGIAGHMATRKIHSLEAGIILIADGCDMEKGRARIPIALNTEPKVGDIHKYSANSIESVDIRKGVGKPVCVEITMSSDVGFFQVEEVLIPKLNMSPAKQYIELFAKVDGAEAKQYL